MPFLCASEQSLFRKDIILHAVLCPVRLSQDGVMTATVLSKQTALLALSL